MQSMFRLPWSTEAPGDKIMEKAALHKPRPLPVVEIPTIMSKFKRKRDDSPEPASPQHAHVIKKWKAAHGEYQPVMAESAVADRVHAVDSVATTEHAMPAVFESDVLRVVSAESLDPRAKVQSQSKESTGQATVPESSQPVTASKLSCAVSPAAASEQDLTNARQAIEAQINYEILLKHNELRLIEQELGKCQVSLEQLRRCSLIPFPGAEGLSESVSGGAGPALQPSPGYTEPQYAAPWGVTDGPYTRHYAKWLIMDPKFDSMPERVLAQQSQGYFGLGEGRTTRGSFVEFGSTGKARTSRTSTGMLKLQALGENPAPTPKIDPLLHKRSTDGQWVRLYCAQCGHSNFSNTQGFLNHCRIKHNQVFKSHDQAAIACGVPVDVNEVGTPVAATEPSSTTSPTPVNTFPAPSNPGIVHPLIRANPSELVKDVHRDFDKKAQSENRAVAKGNFSNSPSTPYMSALLKKRGFEGDLKGLVDTTRSKIEYENLETSDDDMVDSMAVKTPASANPSHLARLPAGVPTSATASKAASARPGSTKGQATGHARLPLSFPPASLHNNDHRMPDSPLDLSPHTMESNPGLVSDHDDDDDDEDGDDAHSQSDIIMNDDVVVEDSSDVDAHERMRSRKGLDNCFEKAEGSRKH